MQKRYESRADIHLCSFDAEGLVQLGNVITEDIRNLRVPVTIAIDLPDGSVRLGGYSEFPEHDEMLRTMHRVMFIASSTGGEHESHQSVYLNLDKDGIRLSVEGTNENWVRGNFARIKDFLYTKRPRILYRVTRFMFLPMFFISALLAIANVLLAVSLNGYFWVSGVLFSALWLSLLLLLRRFIAGTILPHTVFVSSQGTSEIDRVDRIKIVLALLTLLAALVAMVVAVLTLFIPLPIKHT